MLAVAGPGPRALALQLRFVDAIVLDAQDLSVTSNHLEALPNCVTTFTRLTKLTADSNYLQRLPDDIGNLWKLKFLSCGRNQITHLPPSIVDLVALKSLIVYQNRLGDRGIPDSLCDMEGVRELRLSYNAISRLPFRFTSSPIMKTLRILWLYGNCFFDLGDLPLRMSTIRDLRFDVNPLKSPPARYTIGFVKTLQEYTAVRVFRIRDIQRRCEAEGWIVDPTRMVPVAARDGHFIVGEAGSRCTARCGAIVTAVLAMCAGNYGLLNEAELTRMDVFVEKCVLSLRCCRCRCGCRWC